VGVPIYLLVGPRRLRRQKLRLGLARDHVVQLLHPWNTARGELLSSQGQLMRAGAQLGHLPPETARDVQLFNGARPRGLWRRVMNFRTHRKIFLYEPAMLHAKTAVIDDELAIVGTANLDNRSFRLNFEVIAALYEAELLRYRNHIHLSKLARLSSGVRSDAGHPNGRRHARQHKVGRVGDDAAVWICLRQVHRGAAGDLNRGHVVDGEYGVIRRAAHHAV